MSNIPNINRFGITSAIAANGSQLPGRPTVNFAGSGFSIVDNPTNPAGPSTDITISVTNALPHKLTSAGQGPTYTVAETSGEVALSLRSLTAPFVVKAPTAPSLGMKIKITVCDRTFSDVNTVTFHGNGNNVIWAGEEVASQVFNLDGSGYGPSWTFTWDGTDWVPS